MCVLYISVCGTRCDIVEFCVIIFCMWNTLQYCGIFCHMIPCLERILVLNKSVLYFSACRKCSGILLYFSACGMRSSIVEFFYIFPRVDALWYCRISCYNFPCVERVLVLWKFVLYLAACGTRSVTMEFCVILFCVQKALCHCEIFVIFFRIFKFLVGVIQLIFVHVCCIFVFYFYCCIKSVHFL